MIAEPKHKYTLEEYLEIDGKSEERLEYWNGEIFDMSGVSPNHAQIEINLIVSLQSKLSDKKCRIYPANMRIKVPKMPPYRYGDMSALCGTAQFEKIGGVDVLINPSLIIEVLSDSTEAYDRGDKFSHYKSIPSFNEYLLIAQHRPHISHFVKQNENIWVQREYNNLEDSLSLATVSCELPLREVYQNVTFNESPGND